LAPLFGALAGGGISHALAGLGSERLPLRSGETQAILPLKFFERNGMSTQLILVGGFLGAGKTTLLERVADTFKSRGKRVGIVTNDQAANLVDTLVLSGCHNAAVQEVAGGCFCCHFPDLLTALGDLTAQHAPDVILCEPVGSCTDVSATVLQPLKKLHGDQYRLAPFTVLLDPRRTIEAFSGESQTTFPDHVLYIFRKQVEEADLLVINKADDTPADIIDRCRTLLTGLAPNTPVFAISALTGAGVDEWFAQLSGEALSGQRIAEVDYEVYADGEAALGWLNAKVHLAPESSVNWYDFANRLLAIFQEQLGPQSAEIAHVKLRLTAGPDTLTANLTGTAINPSIRGRLGISPHQVQLVFNARVHIAPDQLQEVFQAALAQVSGRDRIEVDVMEVQAFAPVRPQPTHRFATVVA
jgi:Ni2+-binding GTPase involved in maturation of urease and hydrogenase